MLTAAGEEEKKSQTEPSLLTTADNVPLNLRTGKQGTCNLCKKMQCWYAGHRLEPDDTTMRTIQLPVEV